MNWEDTPEYKKAVENIAPRRAAIQAKRAALQAEIEKCDAEQQEIDRQISQLYPPEYALAFDFSIYDNSGKQANACYIQEYRNNVPKRNRHSSTDKHEATRIIDILTEYQETRRLIEYLTITIDGTEHPLSVHMDDLHRFLFTNQRRYYFPGHLS